MRTSLSVLAALLVGLTITATAPSAEACRCMPPDLISQYNNHTDVARVYVQRKIYQGTTTAYKVRVTKTYKGCLKAGQTAYLTTNSSSAACGASLTRGGDYLVNATKDSSGRLWISSCGLNTLFSSLTADQTDFLDTRYNCCGTTCACTSSTPVMCFADPCQVSSCTEGTCSSNYCGGCHAEWYTSDGKAVCTYCTSSADCAFGQSCVASECHTTTF
jgi:hypothetical protein